MSEAESVQPRRVIAVDIDGTICQRNQPPSTRTVEAMRRVEAAGWTITLCTGRRFDRTSTIIEAAGLLGSHVVSDGAEAFTSTGRRLLAHTLANEATCAVLDHASSWGVTAVLGLDDRLVAATDNAAVKFLQSYGDPEPTFVERRLQTVAESSAVFLIYLLDPDDGPRLGKLLTVLAELPSVAARRSVPGFATVVARHVSKGSTLDQLLGADRGSVHLVAVGDGQNDLPVFALANQSYAMGGSPEMVRRAASEVLPPIESDGAALLFERLARCQAFG